MKKEHWILNIGQEPSRIKTLGDTLVEVLYEDGGKGLGEASGYEPNEWEGAASSFDNIIAWRIYKEEDNV